MSRPPVPPFTEQSATEKVRLAEDGRRPVDHPGLGTLGF